MDLSPGVAFFLDQTDRLFFTLGSHLSLTSLACATALSIAVVAWRRHARGRRIRAGTIRRAVLPRRFWRSASSHADLGFVFFNTFVFSLALGWGVLSYQFLANGIAAALTRLLGGVAPTTLSDIAARSIVTVVLFLAYELGYWLNHYLSHRVPLLWEFHRVHHTATVLTPLTNFRVHPVYTLIFSNILALTTGIASGVTNYALGESAYQYALSGTNIILILFIHAYIHLQHSELWISFPGPLGRVFMSPAHHQVHHSSDPAHFDRNLGSCLAVWDWMFGTLYVPGRKSERLRFGVDAGDASVHTITGTCVTPVRRAAAHLKAAPWPLPLPARRPIEP